MRTPPTVLPHAVGRRPTGTAYSVGRQAILTSDRVANRVFLNQRHRSRGHLRTTLSRPLCQATRSRRSARITLSWSPADETVRLGLHRHLNTNVTLRKPTHSNFLTESAYPLKRSTPA